MKTKLLSLISAALLFCSNINAQNYNYSKLTTTYANLTGNVVVSSPGWDDFSIIRLQLPFTFKFFDVNQDSLYIVGGFASFHEHGSGNFGGDEIYFFDVPLGERSIGGASDISVATTGSAPNRIYKVQIMNAGLIDDVSGTESDYANVQLWLYETSNIIEIHNGGSSIAAGTYSAIGLPGPTVGLYQDYISFIALSGSASAPISSTSSPSLYITGTPATSVVYRFAPSAAGINELAVNDIGYFYPNPSTGPISFLANANINNVDISVYNTLGELVQEQKSTSLTNKGSEKIELNLGAGVYFVKIKSEEKQYVQRVVIQ